MSKYKPKNYKHFGSKWLWVEDEKKHIRALNELSPRNIIENIEKKAETLRNSYPDPSFLTENETVIKKNFTKQTLKSQEIPKITPRNKTLKIQHKYKSPWYVKPQYWDKLALIPTVNYSYEKDRAKNLYYYLHQKKIDNKKLSIEQDNFDECDPRYKLVQSQLAELPSVHRFKRYLESKNFRVPACINSLDTNHIEFLNI